MVGALNWSSGECYESTWGEIWCFYSLEWNRLYEEYHSNPYNKADLNVLVKSLLSDEFVTDKKGVYEYALSGENPNLVKLLNVRIFEKKDKQKAYDRQTSEANAKGCSNCPMCAAGNNANKTKI